MKKLLWSLAAIAITPIGASADFEQGEYEILAPDNGQWECHCTCLLSGGTPSPWAEIPGKCESDTEGSSCKVRDGEGWDKGTLTDCESTFVLD